MAQSPSARFAPTLASPTTSLFLRLPALVRQNIYNYLLAPKNESEITTINYTLEWPLLDNPSNTTFAGPVQISLCHCPQLRKSIRNDEHYYTRYRCYGPDVRFHSGKKPLWVLSAPHGQFNILRPATKSEEAKRPNANILRTCKQIYEEAVPTLYQGRNFLFLTGPCPRGRYQAYATQRWLQQLSPLARSQVTCLSLLAQNYEEDCTYDEVPRSYAFLTMYILGYLPGLRTMCLNIWDNNLLDAASEFWMLLKNDIKITVGKDWRSGAVEEFGDVKEFVASIEKWRGKRQRLSWEKAKEGLREPKDSADESHVTEDTCVSEDDSQPEKKTPVATPLLESKLPRRVRSKGRGTRTPIPHQLEIKDEKVSDADWSHAEYESSPWSALGPSRRDKDDEEWEMV